MAGIGIPLNKLVCRENLLGVFQTYFHGAIAFSVPWLFTVISLGSFFLFSPPSFAPQTLENFRSIILYNFSFSLVISAPVMLLASRCLADSIYNRRFSDTLGIMLGSLIILFIIQFPIASVFYFYYAQLSLAISWLAIANYLIISAVWLLTIFISAVTRYLAITCSYVIGLFISVMTAFLFGTYFGAAGMLMGFTLGLGLILSSLIALVFADYPKKSEHLFKFLFSIFKYWDLALGGGIYMAALWIDKWIMWFAPQAEVLPNRLVVFPYYDTAMFSAYLTIVPCLALFLLVQEKSFFETYFQFYQAIQGHANLSCIKQFHARIIENLQESGRFLVLLQCSICLIVLLFSSYLPFLLGQSVEVISIFRFGILGAALHVLVIYLLVLLAYFDYRKGMLRVQVIFLMTNAAFTFAALWLGPSYYGFGYFLSTLCTFLAALIILKKYVVKLPYYKFVTHNPLVT